MDTVLYEAKSFYGVNATFIVLCVVTALVIVLLIVFWQKVDIGVRCLLSFIIVFFLFIIGCQIYIEIDARHKVYNEYIAGNYFEVEGEINDYTLAEKGQSRLPDYFDVAGVTFSVPGFVSEWGYPLNRANGGELEEGLYVRVCYVPYKFENVIMKLEILTKDDVSGLTTLMELMLQL